MSGKTIDQRVVEMQFDNKSFEANSQESIRTLETLRKALKLEEAAKGLDSLTAAGKAFTLASIADGVQALQDRFSTMGIVGMTVIQNLTNGAIEAGKKMLDNLVLNPARMGFQEYETQIGAIQTILANTSSKGTTLNEVNSALDELNTYSDKTIYNFTEMTKNIGTFTAAGVDLKTSVAAIKGIANLAAVSGSTSQQASTAMYQLSQALASGKVSLMDWNSVVNAGMGGQVFQDALKETARAHKIAIDSMIQKNGSFRESLTKEGWLTSEILTETLAKFTGDLNEEQLRSMGYTKEQIAGIVELGQMANDAATKVKTFSQLKDTLAEALQSGWGQTWRILVGDFEESKKLFTSISDALGIVIGRSSDARNSILTGWKQLGGRSLVVKSIISILETLAKVIGIVTDAFKTIFPPVTAYGLYALTKLLFGLTQNFKLSESGAEKLKIIFTGVASVVKIVLDGVLLLTKGLFRFIKTIPISGTSVLDFLVNIAKFLIGIKDTFSSVENLKKALTRLGEFLYTMGQQAKQAFFTFLNSINTTEKVQALLKNIQTWFSSLWTTIQPLISEMLKRLGPFGAAIETIFGKIRDFLTPIAVQLGYSFGLIQNGIQKLNLGPAGSGIISFFSNLGTFLTPLGKLGERILPKILDGLKTLYTNMEPLLARLGESIKVGLGVIWVSIGNALKQVNWGELFQGIAAGGVVAIFLEFRNALKKTGGIVDGIIGYLEGLAGTLDSIQESLKTWQQSVKAGTILKIALAIGILAAALIAISMVDAGKIVMSLGVIVVLFQELMVTMKSFEKMTLGTGAGAVGKVAIELITISAAVFILAFAMNELAKIDAKSIIVTVGAIGALMLGLTTMVNNLNINMRGEFQRQALGIIFLAAGLLIMTQAVKILADVDKDKLIVGLAGLAGILASLVGFTRFAKMDVSMAKAAIGIALLSGAILLMALSMSKMAEIDPNRIALGLLYMGGILASIAAFSRVVGNPAGIIGSAIGIAILAGALYLMQYPLIALASIDPRVIALGLLSMLGVLMLLAAAFRALPGDTFVKALGIVVTAGALYLLAGVIALLGALPLQQVALGMFAIIGVMTALALTLNYMKSSIPGALALLVAAGALVILAGVIALIGSLPIQVIATALGALIAFFIILGVAAAVMSPVIPVLEALSLAVLGIGAATALVGAGIFLFSLGLASLVATLYALGPIIPVLSENFANMLIGISDAIAKAAPNIMRANIIFFMGIIQALRVVVPYLLDTVGLLLTNIVETFAKYAPRFVQAGLDILIAFLDGIYNNTYKIVELAIKINYEFCKGIADNMDLIIQSGWDLMISFVDGMTKSVDANMPTLITKLGELTGAIIAGLVEGIVGGVLAFGGAFTELIDGGIALFKTLLGIDDSSSLTFFDFGTKIIQGLINGLMNFLESLKTTVNTLVTEMNTVITSRLLEFLAKGIAIVQSLIDGVRTKIEDAKGAARSLIEGIKSAISEKISEFVTIGENIAKGVEEGINNLIWKVVAAAKSLAQSVKRIIETTLHIKSPSRVTREDGRYVSQGLALGISDYAKLAVKAAKGMSYDTMNAINEAIAQVGDYFNSDLDSTPTIRPIMDLSAVMSGTNMINGLFGDRNIALARVNAIAGINNTQDGSSDITTNSRDTQPGNNISFVQNNYSPEPLSHFEIYRQTKVQLNTLKGLVPNK